MSKVPLNFIIKRLLEVLPFVAIIALSILFKQEGGMIFTGCCIKASIAVLLILLISATTKFNELLEALRRLHFPKLLIDLLSFMYRYSFLLEDQFLMARRAYQSRNAGAGNHFAAVQVLGNVVGSVFIRTYERAERVYLAMCARGYNEK
jgi:cobalt/nickel transport system permease protein